MSEWMLELYCPKCKTKTLIKPGDMIKCEKCHAQPKILWNGKFHFLEHSKRVKRQFKRRCAVCGRELTITLYDNGTYEGGHFFGNVLHGGKWIEYWECDDCYNKDVW